MEENLRPDTPPPPPPPAITVSNRELTRSNSNASSSQTVTPDVSLAWTDEKHNLYLHHLEASFVKQLHQSKPLLAKRSERDTNMSQKRLLSSKNASEQLKVLRKGGSQKIYRARGEPLPGNSSADSCASLKSKWMSTEKHGKGTISHGFATCSQKYSSSDPRDLFDFKREGTGQNFMDEDIQSTSNFVSQAKRLKTTVAECSSLQDQIVPSTKRPTPTAAYSLIHSSTLGEEQAHHESVSENFER